MKGTPALEGGHFGDSTSQPRKLRFGKARALGNASLVPKSETMRAGKRGDLPRPLVAAPQLGQHPAVTCLPQAASLPPEHTPRPGKEGRGPF